MAKKFLGYVFFSLILIGISGCDNSLNNDSARDIILETNYLPKPEHSVYFVGTVCWGEYSIELINELEFAAKEDLLTYKHIGQSTNKFNRIEDCYQIELTNKAKRYVSREEYTLYDGGDGLQACDCYTAFWKFRKIHNIKKTSKDEAIVSCSFVIDSITPFQVAKNKLYEYYPEKKTFRRQKGDISSIYELPFERHDGIWKIIE